MRYTITIESPHKPTVTFERKRRDAASLCFRLAVYDELKARALLDRPAAQRAMARAEEAERADSDLVFVAVQDVTIRFRKAA